MGSEKVKKNFFLLVGVTQFYHDSLKNKRVMILGGSA